MPPFKPQRALSSFRKIFGLTTQGTKEPKVFSLFTRLERLEDVRRRAAGRRDRPVHTLSRRYYQSYLSITGLYLSALNSQQ
jgi:hypothetical protein